MRNVISRSFKGGWPGQEVLLTKLFTEFRCKNNRLWKTVFAQQDGPPATERSGFNTCIAALLGLVNLAYSPGSVEQPETHPLLAQRSVQLYNERHPEAPITAEQLAEIMAGTIAEDSPQAHFIRSYNHFTHWETHTGILGFPSSQDWAEDSEMQSGSVPLEHFLESGVPWAIPLAPFYHEVLQDYDGKYPGGDQSWGTIVQQKSWKGIGHILHLLQDATVPAHVRDDPHAVAPDWIRYVTELDLHIDSYEVYARDHPERIGGISAESVSYASLRAAFEEVVPFTGEHFYSDNSFSLELEEGRREGRKTYYYREVEGEEIPVARKGYFVPYVLDARVLEEEWRILGKKAVGVGVGMLERFIAESSVPEERFVDRGNGTISDRETGLVWQQGTAGRAMNWFSAEEYCRTLELSGGGWRLAGLWEMTKVNRRGFSNVACGFYELFQGECAGYWSSTTSEARCLSGSAAVEFFQAYSGPVCHNKETWNFQARCVR